ncbi:MAG: nitrous oxide reductase accessory protein NosL [Epsilonproteobacteria bacterium]|nr:nitrous oxide reductase accessory protein NosL [Campylobacterota bacterium]
MFIKKILQLTAILLFLLIPIHADEMFSKVALGEPVLIQEGAKKHWCPTCGMSLKIFYKTSHAKDKKQFCSMRCLIVDRHEHNGSFDKVQVVDAKTEKLIPAKSAFYVVDSEIMGTMTKVSKLAFTSKKDAEAFVEEYDGEIVDFEKALSLAKASLSSDIAMTNAKKEKKIYPMGEKIFKKMCQQNIDLSKYQQINELKSAIKSDKLCKPLKGMRFQALSLYLWEVKRVETLGQSVEIVKVTKEEKCPVCGMFTYKYPKWAAQIFYGEKHYSFDGVKDLMKFYFDPLRWGKYENSNQEKITKILVTDYYTQKAIDGTKAYYVIGSDVLGPMGNELIPFEKEANAKTFLSDHSGKSIIRFDKIVEKEVYKLDE